MNAWIVTAVALLGVCAMAAVGTTEDALAKQLQVVTSRGNVFSLVDSEVGWMNGGGNGTTTTIIIDNSTHTVINNTGSGTGAGALGTSGRIVSIPYDGLLLYGDIQGNPGTIKPAEPFNWYTGTIDYVGFIPKHSVPTRYAWESPYGQYYASGNELTNFGNTRYSIDAIGSRTLEGSAATVRDYSQSIEADVAGKTVIKLDRSGFGNRVLIDVDVSTADVVAQVVTSPNDMLGIPYRDFNGTGKFVFFEGETMRNAERIIPMGHSRWPCGDWRGGLQYSCSNNGGGYVETSSTHHNGKLKYFKFKAGTQTAIPFTADLYVSDIVEAFVDSDITTAVKHGTKGHRAAVLKTVSLDSTVTANSTFSDGLYHVTSFWQESEYYVSVQWRKSGTSQYYTASATGTAAGEGTLRVTDAAPYVVRGDVDPFSSKGTVIQTDSDIYVMLEGTGTVSIRASEVYESDEIDVYGLPNNVPWVLETEDGETVYAGITQNDHITIPVPDNPGVGAYEFSLAVYEDGFSDTVGSGDMLLDLANEEVVMIDFDDPTRSLIYISSNYMRYPMTVSVDIDDVQLAKIRPDCSSTERQRLNFLNKEYPSGSTMNVPFIPGMSALKMTIDDVDACVKFADVLPQVQLAVMRGESRSATNSSTVDLAVNSRSSIVLGSNDPVSVSVSFGGTGFSDVSRATGHGGVTLWGPGGVSLRCTSFYDDYGASKNCPYPAKAITGSLEGQDSWTLKLLRDSFTRYEVTMNIYKNGQIINTATFPINSLTVVQKDAGAAFPSGYQTDDHRWNREVEPLISGNTASGGHKLGSNYGASDLRTRSQTVALAASTWSETFSRTLDIHDGNVGDHIEVEISNKATFRFPHPYDVIPDGDGRLILRDWPSNYVSDIENGNDFLGSGFDELEMRTSVRYGANDRGVFVGLNDGFVIVTPKS